MGATPDQLKADIERTRAELAADVNSLTNKVSPGSVARRRMDALRSGATGVKERVMGTATDVGSSIGDTASSTAGGVSSAAASLTDAVVSAPGAAVTRTQGNPLAAGLIAFGAGLLAASVLPASQKEQQLAEQVQDNMAQPLADAARQSAQQVAQELKPAAQQAVEQVKSTASDAAATTTEHARSAADDVKDTATGGSQTSPTGGYSPGTTIGSATTDETRPLQQ